MDHLETRTLWRIRKLCDIFNELVVEEGKDEIDLENFLDLVTKEVKMYEDALDSMFDKLVQGSSE